MQTNPNRRATLMVHSSGEIASSPLLTPGSIIALRMHQQGRSKAACSISDNKGGEDARSTAVGEVVVVATWTERSQHRQHSPPSCGSTATLLRQHNHPPLGASPPSPRSSAAKPWEHLCAPPAAPPRRHGSTSSLLRQHRRDAMGAPPCSFGSTAGTPWELRHSPSAAPPRRHGSFAILRW